VGIGDINSSFLPPKPDPLLTQPSLNPSSRAPSLPPPEALPTLQKNSVPDTAETLADAEVDVAEVATAVLLSKQTEVLSAQLEQRPLAKKQEELLEGAEKPQATVAQAAETTHNGIGNVKEKSHRQALLKSDDGELERVKLLLTEVHRRFFNKYERSFKGARVDPEYDVRVIIPQIKTETFAGTHLLFSSVIPLEVDPQTSDVWRMAQQFGAACYSELSPRLTHLVTAKRATAKVDAARRRGNIKIVWMSWFTDSIGMWKAQDEDKYLVDGSVSTFREAADASQSTTTLNPAPKQAVASQAKPADVLKPPVEADAEDLPGHGAEAELETIDVDWADISREVDEAMNETDDGEEYGTDDGNDSVLDSSPPTPSRGKKRDRSLTPSDLPELLSAVQRERSNQSPAKRLKLSSQRRGSSRLKEEISPDAEEVEEEEHNAEADADVRDENGEEGEDGSDPDSLGLDDDDDDFLIGELTGQG